MALQFNFNASHMGSMKGNAKVLTLENQFSLETVSTSLSSGFSMNTAVNTFLQVYLLS